MPNTREIELWRLVNKAFQNSIERFGDIFAKDVTRDLLAHGVTVQEWISVKDRLPEVFVPVLVKYLNYNDGSASPTYVDTAVLLEGDVWYWWEGDLADCDNEVKCTITHWMPLPEPPREKSYE